MRQGAWFATAGKRVQVDSVAAWLATIRHRQVAVVFICQSPEQLERRILVSSPPRRLPSTTSTRRLGWFQQSLVRVHTGFRYSHELRKQKSDGVISSGRWSPDKRQHSSHFKSVDFRQCCSQVVHALLGSVYAGDSRRHNHPVPLG